jgi:hemolysin III
MAAATLTAIDLKKYKKLSMVFYLAMGWAIVAILGMTLRALTLPGFLWLLAGGLCYTVGAVFYGIGKKRRYMHGVFHLFVNAGSLLQAIAILRYVL